MSTPLTALIVDDETLARQLLRRYLKAHEDIVVVGESANGEAALADIATLAPDLVFLDIQMPRLSGLEVLELSGRRQGVIFTTAYDAFALQAFEKHAVDYLLKPFSQARFDEALRHARELFSRSLPDAALREAAPLGRILIRDRGQILIVPLDRIDSIEAQDDYIAIHAEGKVHLKTQSLNDMEKSLDPQRFVRVHRSHLINVDYLVALERQGKDAHSARLKTGRNVPVSRTGYARLAEALQTGV